MDFPCPGFPQKLYQLNTGVAANHRIIYQHYPLIPDSICNRGKLDFYLVNPLILPGRDKGSPDVLVLDQADAVWDSGGFP